MRLPAGSLSLWSPVDADCLIADQYGSRSLNAPVSRPTDGTNATFVDPSAKIGVGPHRNTEETAMQMQLSCPLLFVVGRVSPIRDRGNPGWRTGMSFACQRGHAAKRFH